MANAENAGNGGCLQRDSTECKEYAGAQSADQPETGETGVREPKLLERILFRDNLTVVVHRHLTRTVTLPDAENGLTVLLCHNQADHQADAQQKHKQILLIVIVLPEYQIMPSRQQVSGRVKR